MCACGDNGFVCSKCAGTRQDPRYLEDEPFTTGPFALPPACSVRDGEQSECPRCHSTAVDDACDRCGWSRIEQALQGQIRARERETDWLPTLPLALFVDEFAPADVEDEAA